VRGQPAFGKKAKVQYMRPMSYFVVQRDGKTIEFVDQTRSVKQPRGKLLALLKGRALRSHRRTYMEKAFKFLWVLTINGEFLVTEEHPRSHEDRFTNHGDLVPASLVDCVNGNNSTNIDSNVVENVEVHGKYRGIARMGGELIVTLRTGIWLMNNISGFSLARVAPGCDRLPVKKTYPKSDAAMDNLNYDSLVELRNHLKRFIFNIDKVILLSGDIAGVDLKVGFAYKIRMKDLLNVYLNSHQIG